MSRTPAWQLEWKKLTHRIERCTWCHLAATRRHAVPYRGGTTPKVLFVGEAPGRDEDRTGVPFAGAAGAVLDRGIATLGLAPEEIGITNVFKCRPPKNRFDAVAARECRPHLEQQLALLEPRIVVTLGAHALTWFDPEAPPVTRSAGTVRTWRERPLFPMLHPASTFRSGTYARRWKTDLVRLGNQLPRWLE
jgi:uracil-DNA glycosylase